MIDLTTKDTKNHGKNIERRWTQRIEARFTAKNAKESITIKEFNYEKVCGVFDVRKYLQAFT